MILLAGCLCQERGGTGQKQSSDPFKTELTTACMVHTRTTLRGEHGRPC